uniref:Renalase, FAD-dependent amine oxidase n=1 Tax=Salarias fasciatus TaxID=181472 RepID=A0A672FGN2_SALFA
MSRVLIVGAGLTGSLCACLLRRELQSKVHIVVWDKSRGAGGRMSTSRSPDPSSHPADLGAQYISATPAYAQSHQRYHTPEHTTPNYHHTPEHVTVNHNTPEHITRADLFLERHVTGRKVGESETFDAVVLTMPVPQILQLEGDVGPLLSVQQKQQLDGVAYSSRFALALFFPPDAVFSFPWGARYVSESDCIRYIAVDPRKCRSDPAGRGPSMVVHTSVPFGVEHLEEDKEEVKPVILQELYKLLPDLPQPISIKCHKWRYSQVLTTVPDCPGHMTVLNQPPLVCGGDAFTHSNFDGCVESALSLLGALKSSL